MFSYILDRSVLRRAGSAMGLHRLYRGGPLSRPVSPPGFDIRPLTAPGTALPPEEAHAYGLTEFFQGMPPPPR